jgi:hypothetical protein
VTGLAVVQVVSVPNSASGSFTTPTTPGNCVVYVITTEETSDVTMSVTGATLGGSPGNFTQAVSVQSGYGDSVTQLAAIWVNPGCAGGQTAVGITGTNLGITSGSDNGFTAYEIQGPVTVLPVDQYQSASGTASTAVTTGTTGTTGQPSEIVIAGLSADNVLSGFTAGYTTAVMPGSFNTAATRIIASAGAQAFSATQSAAGPYAGAIVTLRAYVPGPGGGLLIPPGISSPANFTRRAVPSQAPPLLTLPEAGGGADTGTVSAGVSSADAGSGAESATAQPGAADLDTGHGTDTGTVASATASGPDTGSGADGATGTAYPVGADTGSGAESSSVTVRPLVTVRWNAPDKVSISGDTMHP